MLMVRNDGRNTVPPEHVAVILLNIFKKLIQF